MNQDTIIAYILEHLAGVELVELQGDSYFFYGSNHQFSMVTLVTGDRHDTVSDLDRPSVYRLNIGITKQSFRALFGAYDASSGAGAYDFTALDRLMPHPVYGNMYWVCILDPSEDTFQRQVQPLLHEAYEQAVAKQAKRDARAGQAR